MNRTLQSILAVFIAASAGALVAAEPAATVVEEKIVIDLNTDDLNSILFKHARAGKLRGKI